MSIITQEVIEYKDQHNLEENLTKSVNEIFRTLPPDPFSNLCQLLKKNSQITFLLNSIEIKNIIIGEFQEIPSLIITMTFQGNTRKILTYPLPFSSSTFEKFKENYEPLLNCLNNVFNDKLTNFPIENIEKFDDFLMETLHDANSLNDDISIALTNSFSICAFISMSLMKEEILPQFIREIYPNYIVNENSIPNIGFTLFKTGKNMNSKIKFERFILFVNNQKRLEPKILYDLFNKIYENIHKTLTAGKAGEAGMKLNDEGSFFSPTDKIEDLYKLIEQLIKDINDENIYFGIDCNSNNYYNEKDNTYEMDGFKKPINSDELIDFYIKLCNDHPLLLYLEEPLAEKDKEGWEKLTEKFDKEKPNITISKKVELYKEIEEPKLILNDEEEKKEENKKEENKKEEEKKEEEKKEEEEEKNEEEESLNLPYNCVTYKLGEIKVITDMLRDIEEITKDNEEMKVNLWEYDHESEQTSIIDIGFGIRANNIILNGFTMEKQKILKLNRFIELINDIYENTPEEEEEEDENEQRDNPGDGEEGDEGEEEKKE